MKSVFFDNVHKCDKSYRHIQHSLGYKRWMTNTRTCSVPTVPSWNNANTKKKLVDEINPWMQLVTVMPTAREWMGCCDVHALWLEGSPPATKFICFLIHSITAVFLSFSFWVCFCVRCFCFLYKFHTPTPHSFHYKHFLSFVTAVFGFVHFCLFRFLYNQMPHLPLIQCPLHNSNYAKSLVYLSTFRWLGIPRGVTDTLHLTTLSCSFWQ